MNNSSYKSYTEYTLDIGDAAFVFFTDKGAIAGLELANAPIHSHNHCELFYVTKGKIEIRTPDETYTLNENDAALIPSGIFHQTSGTENSQRVVISFGVSKSKTKSKEKFYSRFHPITEDSVVILRSFVGGDAFHRFARYYYGNFREKHQLILSCLYEIIVLVKEFASKKISDEDALLPDSILYRNYIISDYIFSKNTNKKSLAELSKLLHLSCQQTHRIVKSMYGKSFMACLQDDRMNNALHMVQTTSLSFSEISAKVGYKCTHSFFSAFKKHYGTTPGKMRASAIIFNGTIDTKEKK